MPELTAIQLAEAESLVRQLAGFETRSENVPDDPDDASDTLDALIIRARAVLEERPAEPAGNCGECNEPLPPGTTVPLCADCMRDQQLTPKDFQNGDLSTAFVTGYRMIDMVYSHVSHGGPTREEAAGWLERNRELFAKEEAK